MNPYTSLPKRAFWSKSSGSKFDGSTLVNHDGPLLRTGEKVVSAGSCFAANLVPYLEEKGITYVRTEYNQSFYKEIPPENFSYAKFSAGYGNLYTGKQLLQLLQRCMGTFVPQEDVWEIDGRFVDPFRPGLRYAARTRREYDVLRRQHFQACLNAFRQCDVFIFTLGLTEAWRSTLDNAVYPACPGTVAGVFDASRHEFINYGAAEVSSDIREAVTLLRTINPAMRIILTVSPVPLIATASGNHVVPATVYSKSVLRVAAQEVADGVDGVTYFPSYEIVTAPHLEMERFESDRRSVRKECIDEVMRIFFLQCDISAEADQEAVDVPAAADPAALSALLSAAECEEAMADVPAGA